MPDDFDKKLADLVGAEKERPGLSEDKMAKLAARLDLSMDMSDVSDVPGPTASEAATAARVAPSAKLLPLVAAFGAGIVTGAVGHALLQEKPQAVVMPAPDTMQQPTVQPAPQPTLVPTLVSVPLVAAPDLAAGLSAAASAKKPKAEPKKDKAAEINAITTDATLAQERRYIERARAALLHGNASAAVAAVREYQERFVDGQLREEASSVLVQSLLAQGEKAQAKKAALEFLRRYPQSLFTPLIKEALKDSDE